MYDTRTGLSRWVECQHPRPPVIQAASTRVCVWIVKCLYVFANVWNYAIDSWVNSWLRIKYIAALLQFIFILYIQFLILYQWKINFFVTFDHNSMTSSIIIVFMIEKILFTSLYHTRAITSAIKQFPTYILHIWLLFMITYTRYD